MRKFISSILGLSLFSLPAVAEPTKGYYTMDAMGCMLLKECTKDIEKITSSDDLRAAFPCLLYTSPSPRDATLSRMPSSA